MKLIGKKCCKSERTVLHRLLLSLFFSFTLTQLTFSQVEISGKVIDQDGEPIVGATIIVKGTTTGVITNVEGEYTIQANEGDILDISFIGYLTEEVIYESLISIKRAGADLIISHFAPEFLNHNE